MFDLTISHDNAAFDNDRVAETVRILRQLADRLEGEWLRHDAKGNYYSGVNDINGIPCGHWSFTPRSE